MALDAWFALLPCRALASLLSWLFHPLVPWDRQVIGAHGSGVRKSQKGLTKDIQRASGREAGPVGKTSPSSGEVPAMLDLDGQG